MQCTAFHFGCPTGAADPATHKIYIWDISNDGQFASALDGGREPLIDVHVRFFPSFYNPIPILLCLSSYSGIHLRHALPQPPTKVRFSSGIVPPLNGGVRSREDLRKRMRMSGMKKESQSLIWRVFWKILVNKPLISSSETGR